LPLQIGLAAYKWDLSSKIRCLIFIWHSLIYTDGRRDCLIHPRFYLPLGFIRLVIVADPDV